MFTGFKKFCLVFLSIFLLNGCFIDYSIAARVEAPRVIESPAGVTKMPLAKIIALKKAQSQRRPLTSVTEQDIQEAALEINNQNIMVYFYKTDATPLNHVVDFATTPLEMNLKYAVDCMDKSGAYFVSMETEIGQKQKGYFGQSVRYFQRFMGGQNKKTGEFYSGELRDLSMNEYTTNLIYQGNWNLARDSGGEIGVHLAFPDKSREEQRLNLESYFLRNGIKYKQFNLDDRRPFVNVAQNLTGVEKDAAIRELANMFTAKGIPVLTDTVFNKRAILLFERRVRSQSSKSKVSEKEWKQFKDSVTIASIMTGGRSLDALVRKVEDATYRQLYRVDMEMLRGEISEAEGFKKSNHIRAQYTKATKHVEHCFRRAGLARQAQLLVDEARKLDPLVDRNPRKKS